MTKEEREELKRLQIASLRQGGLILKQQFKADRDAKKHAEDDAKFQSQQIEINGKINGKQKQIEETLSWHKKAGLFLFAWTGIGKLF